MDSEVLRLPWRSGGLEVVSYGGVMLHLTSDRGYVLTFTPQSNEFTVTLHTSALEHPTLGLCCRYTPPGTSHSLHSRAQALTHTHTHAHTLTNPPSPSLRFLQGGKVRPAVAPQRHLHDRPSRVRLRLDGGRGGRRVRAEAEGGVCVWGHAGVSGPAFGGARRLSPSRPHPAVPGPV